MMNAIYEDSFSVSVRAPYRIVGAVHMKNGCCSDKPVLITVNTLPSGELNYSCQCACDGWCTTGRSTASKALEDYERMSR